MNTLKKINMALDVVKALTSGAARWTMSIPARDNDHDIVVGRALIAARRMAERMDGHPDHEPVVPALRRLGQWEVSDTIDMLRTRLACVSAVARRLDPDYEMPEAERRPSQHVQRAVKVVHDAAAEVYMRELVGAAAELRVNANRLCDRQLGGTYEEDCRRSLARIDKALARVLSVGGARLHHGNSVPAQRLCSCDEDIYTVVNPAEIGARITPAEARKVASALWAAADVRKAEDDDVVLG